MSYVINKDACIVCHGCKDACPVDAISPVPWPYNVEYYYIDPDVCYDCGMCMDYCPVGAITAG
jgi:NAD-dependent dihydropyrimidine dehydrogenase PreA subunit